MIRLLHLADVHLGAPLRGFGAEAESRGREVLDAFRRLPELAEEHRVDAVLIVGDLFDRPRPPDPVVIAVRETARRLVEGGFPIFAVPGNHDPVSLAADLYPGALPGATVFSAPRFAEPVCLDVGERRVWFHGVAYDAGEEPDPLATFSRDGVGTAVDAHVVLLHGTVPGAPHWEPGGNALELPLERLKTLGVHYIALGDHHRFRSPEEFPPGVPACYPGSFAAVDVSETGTHGWVRVELSTDGVGAELVSGGAREVEPVGRLDVTDLASEDAVADRAASRISGTDAYPVVTLTGEPGFPMDADGVAARLKERFGFAVVHDESRYIEAARVEELACENTVAGHVARIGRERIATAAEAERDVAADGLRIALRVLEVR